MLSIENYLHRPHLGDACHLPLPDQSVNLVIASPPYLKARDYGVVDGQGKKIMLRSAIQWVDWMLEVTKEACRICNGLVIWVVRGELRSNNYQPGPEGLVWEWHKRNGYQFHPCYWLKNGMAGSGGPYWFRNNVEYILAFKTAKGAPPYANPTAMGGPPKYRRGGRMSHRMRDGSRVNKPYPLPEKTNPGNVLHVPVGGGHMGDELAHQNEAPFPLGIPEFFITTHSRPGDAVLDPFCGSGTTLAAAKKLGRVPIGFDCRESQVALSQKRLDLVTPLFPAMRQ